MLYTTFIDHLFNCKNFWLWSFPFKIDPSFLNRREVIYNNVMIVVTRTKTFDFNTRMAAIIYDSWCLSGEKQTPRCSLSSFCIEKLKYLFFLSLDTFIEVTSERYPDTETSKWYIENEISHTFWKVPDISDCCQTFPPIVNRFESINFYCPWPRSIHTDTHTGGYIDTHSTYIQKTP